MSYLLSTASRLAIAAAATFAVALPSVAMAATYEITNGQTQTTNQNITDSDHLTIDDGGAITGSVNWTGVSTAAVIDNYGTMGSSTSSTRAFQSSSLNTAAPKITINNHTTGVIQSTGDTLNIGGAIGTTTNHGSVTLNNDGLIETYGGNQAIDFDKATNGTVTINNNLTGQILGTPGTDIVRPGQNATVNNAGLIKASTDEFDFGTGGDAVDFQSNSGGLVNNLATGVIEGDHHAVTGKLGVTVNNYGTLTGRNGSGVNIDNDATVGNTVYVNNYATGVITGEAVDATSTDADGDAIDADGLVNVQNYGLVQGLGASGIHEGQVNVSEAIAMGGGVVYNYATGVIHSVQTAITVDDSNLGPAYAPTIITNEGKIQGDDGTAINIVGVQNDSITNRGTIVGDIHMDLGSDTLNEYAGATLDGTLDGGNGVDTINLLSAAPSGTGTLGKTENFETLNVTAGSWTLTDDQSYAEGTNISDGATLYTDHTLIGKVAVNAGGTLAGNGTFTYLYAYDSSGYDPNKFINVAPGGFGSIGEMNIDTDGVIEHTNYDVDVDAAGNADRIHAAGVFTIFTYPDTPDNLIVTAAPGAYAASTTYTIITADGGLGGTFSGVTDNLAFLDPSLSYDANNAYLTLTRNDLALWDVAETANQDAVAHAIGGGVIPSTLYDQIVAESADEARADYDSLSGETYASNAGTLADQAALIADTILSRFGGAGDQGQGGAPLGYGDDTRPVGNAAGKALADAPVYSAWAKGFGQTLSETSDGNAADLKGDLGGGLVGMDMDSAGVRAGFAAGFANASSNVADRSSSSDMQTGIVAAYAGTETGAVRFHGGASYGWSSVDTERTATAGAITERPTASYDAGVANAFVEASQSYRLAGFGLEPFAGLAYTNVAQGAFTEQNAPVTGLSSDAQSFGSLYSTLGMRVASSFNVGDTVWRNHAMLGWRHAYGDLSPERTMTFQETGASFLVDGTPIAGNSAVVEAGVDAMLGASATLGVAYSGALSNNGSSHTVKVSGGLQF